MIAGSLALIVVALTAHPGSLPVVAMAMVSGGVLTLVFVVLPGFVIPLLPNLLGTALLVWVGARRPWMRHPTIWAATVFVLAWLLSLFWSGKLALYDALLGIVGALWALICRRHARWHD